jgi:hypothetical protein
LLFFLIATGLFVTVLTYLYTWISQRFFGSQDGFVVGVRQVRELVEQAQQGVLRARSAEDALASALLAAASGAQDEHAAAAALAVARAQRDVTERWSDLDRLDGEATNTLAQLWMDLRRPADGSYDGKKRSTRTWATRALILEHMIELFDLSPTPIPLPRMLCVLRFKSTDFRERTTVADWDFESSLEAVRFAPREVKLLDGWLSALGNPEQIKNWDVATFVRVLAEHGVSASPALRKPNLWQGSLEGADKAPAART